MFKCEVCDKSFSRRDALTRHKRQSCAPTYQPPAKKVKKTIHCDVCDVEVLALHHQGHLRSNEHKSKCIITIDDIQKIKTAFKCRIASYRITNQKAVGITEFLKDVEEKVIYLLNSQPTPYKLNMELFGVYVKLTNGEEVESVKSFNTKFIPITSSTDLNETIQQLNENMMVKADEFQERDSGWALKRVLYIEININKYSPLRGSSYIELPPDIRSKQACINVQNSDQLCFLWAVLSALHPVDGKQHPERLHHYQGYIDELHTEGIEFPMKIRDINKFEDLNNISINIFSLEYDFKWKRNIVVGPLHHTKQKRHTHINLLLVEDGVNNHYVWIKDLPRLVKAQLGGRDYKKFLCDGCLILFHTEDKLKQHQTHDCNHISTILPNEGENILKFENYERKLKLPFVVYADFESVLKPVDTCNPNPIYSYTNTLQMHEPHSFAYYIKCFHDDNLSKLVVYRGDDAAEQFVQNITADIKRIYHNHLRPIIPMHPMSPKEKNLHNSSNICHICNRKFILPSDKVHDHCHLTGKYRGPAHNKCNLKFQNPKMIPIFFHNLSGYDAHLFVKDLAFDEEKIDVIPENKEKYISFTKFIHVDKIEGKNIFMKLRFLDSFRFMASSIEKLAQNLKPDQFRETNKFYPDQCKFNLVIKKGVFPYSYIDSFEKLKETKLPVHKQFYDSINNMDISDSDYKHACTVWNTFNCQTLGEYSDIYLKTDVLLLADIFENFRDVCWKTYELDPCQYFTAPGLSWDAMLKHTCIKLELLTDIDMLHFIKRGIRGGIAQCSGRYSRANNQYCPDYNPTEKTKFLMYWDANNLYGLAQSQHLPHSGFRWLTPDEISNLDVKTVSNTSENGYILEVDLNYPQHLHNLHNDLPFCAESIAPPGSKLKKLIPNLNDKKKYVIDYRNLKQALANGLILDKVHRVLTFKQSPWLSKYIDLNTELRKKASNDFEKDFFKLMNNANFGKTMENVDKRVDVKLITHWENKGKRQGAGHLIAKLNFHSCSIFSETLVAIQMNRVKVVYNKPIYLGFCILELSKEHMYDFYYHYVKNKYADKVNLLYSDTDSLVCEIMTDDIYEDIKQNLDFFDTSNYTVDNKFNLKLCNKAVLGKMKDECAGKIMYEFIGLRSKMYSMDIEGKFIKKAKGVKKNVVKNALNHDDYRKVLFEGSTMLREQIVFRSIKHQIHTQKQNKVALSSKDDKRFLIPESMNTYAWGHYAIMDSE